MTTETTEAEISAICSEISTLRHQPENLYRIYESIWRNMARENDVMNYRLNWAIVFSTGTFTATAVLLTVVTIILGPNRSDAIDLRNMGAVGGFLLLMSVLSATGVMFSVRARQGVLAAQEQHNYLKLEYANYQGYFSRLGWPRPFGEQSAHDRGNKAAIVFPVLLIRIWMSAAVIELVLAAAAFTYVLMQR